VHSSPDGINSRNSHLVELLEDRLVEALADPIGLRTLYFCAGAPDVIERQIELVLVTVCVSVNRDFFTRAS